MEEIINSGDLKKIVEELVEELKTKRKVLAKRQGDTIVLNRSYQIDLDRVPNHAALVEWILHLTEKTWVDSLVIEAFIFEVCKAKGWEIYGNHD